MKITTVSFRSFFRVFCALLFLCPSILFGQADSLRYKPDVFRFADGVAYTLSSPVRWDGKDWVVLGGLIAGTSALTFLDQPVRAFWQQRDSRVLHGVERVGYHYGKPYSAIGLTAGFICRASSLRTNGQRKPDSCWERAFFPAAL